MNWTESEYAIYQRRLQDRHPDTLFESTEVDFLAQVRAHAKQQGWLFFIHTTREGVSLAFQIVSFFFHQGSSTKDALSLQS